MEMGHKLSLSVASNLLFAFRILDMEDLEIDVSH